MSNDSIWSSPKIPFYTMAMLTTALVIYHLIAICYYSRRLPGTTTTTTTTSTTTTTGAAGDVPSSTMVANTPVVRMINNSIPAHKYRKGGISGNLVGEDGVCAVCLGEFEDGEELRTLPECLHSFHVSCIDIWLFSHPNCPICRADTFPS